jgi:MFS family permease
MRLVGVVSAAHFVSHYYILLLAPLLPFVRAEYGVSYTEIGLALAAFNIVSAALQTPAGFLVDRLGARVLLIIGLATGASAFVIAGLVDSFWVLVAMFALAGVGNTIYHPADYALLSQQVPSKSIGQAFSIHTFAGMLGSSVAPASLLLMQNIWGWRGAFIGAGILGFAVAAILLAVRDNAATTIHAMPPRDILADPTQLVLVHAARSDEWRHLQLLGGRARRAIWHFIGHRQYRLVRPPIHGSDRRTDWRTRRHPHLSARIGRRARPWRDRAGHLADRQCRPRVVARCGSDDGGWVFLRRDHALA